MSKAQTTEQNLLTVYWWKYAGCTKGPYFSEQEARRNVPHIVPRTLERTEVIKRTIMTIDDQTPCDSCSACLYEKREAE